MNIRNKNYLTFLSIIYALTILISLGIFSDFSITKLNLLISYPIWGILLFLKYFDDPFFIIFGIYSLICTVLIVIGYFKQKVEIYSIFTFVFMSLIPIFTGITCSHFSLGP